MSEEPKAPGYQNNNTQSMLANKHTCECVFADLTFSALVPQKRILLESQAWRADSQVCQPPVETYLHLLFLI